MSQGSPFKAGEKVFCYQGPLLYEAKILSLKLEKDKTTKTLYLHYNGWSKNWDEWVSESRVFRINDETLQKKRELESAQKKAERIKALKRSSRKVIGKRKVSQTQENASQQNGLNPKSTCSTKRKISSICENDNESENEDFTKVWKGCQALRSENEVMREPGVPSEPCPECNERQIVEAFRYKSIHQQAGLDAKPCTDAIIWFKRLKDLGFVFTSIPDISNENHTSSTDHPAAETPKKTHVMDADLKMHQCHMCPFSSNTLRNFKRHLNTHTGKRSHTCDLCQWSFARSDSLRKHRYTHSAEKRYQCSICNRGFTRSDTLRTHRYTHLAEKRYQCSICNRGFTRMLSVQRHIAAVHPKIRKEDLRCDICHRLYPDEETLKKHKRQHPHMIPDRRHKCPKCPYSADKSTNVRIHLLTHNVPTFSCPTCNKLFTLSSNLKKHTLTHFPQERPFQCPTCSKTFGRSNHLREHLNSVHSSGKLFQCSHCPKTFTTCDYRNKHEKVHSADKYECPQCGNLFAKMYNLKRHIICVHTHDYPHKCDECGKGFLTPKEVKVHEKTCNVTT